MKIRLLSSLLEVKKTDRTIFQIIFWWELRRILYNLIVLVAGIISIAIMYFAASGRVELESGEDFFEPILIPIFAIICNVGYTLGWLTEICIKRSTVFGPKMFKYGLYFTLFCIFLPANLWIIIAIVEEVKKMI